MVHLTFQNDPDFAPSGKLPIFGQSRCGANRMRAYAVRRNPQAPDVAELYLEKAEAFGIRGDVAFCQAMLDTQVWTAEPQGPPWKPFAYRVWGALGYCDRSDEELARRVDRHLQILSEIVDSHKTEEPCWEELGGTWAISDSRYGYDVVAVWRNMMAWGGDEVLRMEENQQAGARLVRSDGKSHTVAQVGRKADDHLAWLARRAWVPSPRPYPGRKVSWGELSRVIGSLEKQRGAAD